MSEQTVQATGASGDESALRELAIRLLTFHYGAGGDETARQPALLVGAMPPDLPIQIPLPEGSRLFGSLMMANPIIALDAPVSGDEVIAFYQDRLVPLGWREQVPGPRQGGFASSTGGEREFAHFVTPDGQHTLAVMTAPAGEDHTAIQLSLLAGDMGFPRRHGPGGREMWGILPPVHAPKRSTQRPLGGGAGPDHVESRAMLETDLNLAGVSSHYTSVLERAGWRPLETGMGGRAAWSEWSFADVETGPWFGLLFIVQRRRDPRQYDLVLQAEPENEPQQGGAGSVVASSGYSSYQLLGRQAHTAITSAVVVTPPKPETPE